jgi:RNA-directed DNA polymerase
MQIGEQIKPRNQGTPQGGIVSPLLANLFLHYAFDVWVKRELPQVPFCRYADDGLLHCRTKRQAEYVMAKIAARFKECKLEIHPDKSKIVYCKDRNRTENHPIIQFDFLGYTFRPRKCVDNKSVIHPNYLPAISSNAKKAIHATMRSWHVQLKTDKELNDIANMCNPSKDGINTMVASMHQKCKGFGDAQQLSCRWALEIQKVSKTVGKARQYIKQLAKPNLFVHWQLGATLAE